MKNVFVATLLVCGMGAFANPHESKPVSEQKKSSKSTAEASIAQACCRRTASDGTGQSVSVTDCISYSGADNYNVAMGIACGNAANLAQQALVLIKKT
ncbi:hypothetical protein [Flavobacterium silvaticum]|uniref:Uncharacterized protein n=1 Tax=Flavobacterium silvaticum TaxID=1852020 RepID=A0A972JEV5_9FLAO|nr:hypothetical protein [Flavobacterium silvaticum]NMH27299.1 hypothetical protein [Flavobacterium silvaticum]